MAAIVPHEISDDVLLVTSAYQCDYLLFKTFYLMNRLEFFCETLHDSNSDSFKEVC